MKTKLWLLYLKYHLRPLLVHLSGASCADELHRYQQREQGPAEDNPELDGDRVQQPDYTVTRLDVARQAGHTRTGR